MSIFNILDDVYDVESPMEKIMSAAKKKKDKSVTVTKKEKDPFLDGFNLFANEEKKEKSHLDSVSSREKSKNAYIMPQGSWWRKLSGENEVQKAAGENAARKKAGTGKP